MNEMKEQELASTMGGLGLIETIVAASAILVITQIVNNWDAFKAGLMGMPEPVKSAAK